MKNSILIGKLIYNKLSESEELKKYVGNKIFPLVAENSTTFPFIIFTKTSISSKFCKDGFHEDNVGFTIIVVSTSYIESLEIASQVRDIFEKDKLSENIYNCILNGVKEDWQENAYLQQLDFVCSYMS